MQVAGSVSWRTTLYFEGVSKYSFYGAILGYVKSRGVSPHTMSTLHRIHCSEEHSLSSSFDAFSSWNQSISYYRIQFTRVPDVVEVLGKSCRNQYIVLQLRINSTFSWVSLNCSKVQELIGRVWIHTILKSFLRSSSCCWIWCPIFKQPLLRSSLCHCSGSLRRFLEGLIDDVAIIEWLLLTLHNTILIVWTLCFNVNPFPFKNRNRNWCQRCCGLLSWSCFSNEFPEAVSYSFSIGIDSVTYLSTPFTVLTHETVLSGNRDGTWTSTLYCSSR